MKQLPGAIVARMGSAEPLSDEEESSLRALLEDVARQQSDEGSISLLAAESPPEDTLHLSADAMAQRLDVGNAVSLLL